MNKTDLLKQAIEITEEYAKSGNANTAVEEVLENVYNKLKQLNEDAKTDG